MMPGLRERVYAWRWPLCAVLITGIGLVIRLCMAWAMRFPACNGDFSIIGLMARHMARGTDYPVFAYGVAYMGSLEPALAALIAKLFRVEVTAFIVNLSPALVGTLLLPLLYLFGRDAGTRRAGILAMLFCLVGSDTLLHNSIAPRGGYMNVMVFGLSALWLACRIAARESRGERVPWWTYLGMGLAAGVAWWVTQLVVVFLLAAGLVLMTGFRWRMVRVGLIPALLGVLLGSLPWWVWNHAQHWGSLDFGDGAARVPFSQGVISFGQMFLRLIEMDPLMSPRGLPRLLVLIGLGLAFIVVLIRDRRRAARDDRFYFRLGALFLFVGMVLIYSTSAFSRVNTTRYLLPLFPAMAVMIAVASDRIWQQYRIPWGVLAFILVIPPHILLLPKMFDGVAADRVRWETAAQLQEETATLCDGNYVGDLYSTHWINFASKEQLCVTSLPLERYAPYARRVELAERRAYLNGYGNLGSFLQATKSGSRQKTVGNMTVDYGLIPPSDDWHYIDASETLAIRDQRGVECRGVLQDSILDTAWTTLLKPRSSAMLSATFLRPVRLCGIRLFSLINHYPWQVSIEGRADANAPWQVLLPTIGVSTYFWSGPYVMIDGVQYFQEFRVNASQEGIREVRLVCHGAEDGEEPIRLDEVLFLESGKTGSDASGAEGVVERDPARLVTRCVETLREEGLTRFYGPRWLAERVSVAMSNAPTTLIPSLLSRGIHEMATMDSRDPYPLEFSDKTGLAMDTRDVARSRRVLRDAELVWREIVMGPLTLMVVEADRLSHAGAIYPRIFWTEQGCFGAEFSKERAQLCYQEAEKLTGETNLPARLKALKQAVDAYPAHSPALAALVASQRAAGRIAEARSNETGLCAMTKPSIPGDVHFDNGVELVGVTVAADGAVRRGDAIPMTYYWKCAPLVMPERWAVFVHLEQNKVLFQDDHVLLEETPIKLLRYQPFAETFIEQRNVTIPANAVAGDYQVWVGLLDRKSGKRVRFSTGLQNRRNAAELPVTLHVQ